MNQKSAIGFEHYTLYSSKQDIKLLFSAINRTEAVPSHLWWVVITEAVLHAKIGGASGRFFPLIVLTKWKCLDLTFLFSYTYH